MMTGSLRVRLFLAAAISIAIALFLTGLALVRMFEDQVRERVITGLENDLLQLAGSINIAADGSVSVGKALADPRYQEPYGGRYWRIDFLPVEANPPLNRCAPGHSGILNLIPTIPAGRKARRWSSRGANCQSNATAKAKKLRFSPQRMRKRCNGR